jgi:Family of unknown function (DUF6717)
VKKRTFVRLAAALLLAILSGFSIYVLQSAPHPITAPAMNSLYVIAPYKYQGSWVFDDPSVGLHREPFVLGIDTMIDKIVANVPDAERGFRAIFSARQFPGAETKLEWHREESGGNWYYSDKFKTEGWLCPALFKYFPTAPREIWVKVEPLGR